MRVFKNAKIYSMDKNDSVYEALAVENGMIAFAGTNEEVLKKYPNAEEIIDLEGKTVIPGFNDSCVRFVEYARFNNTMLDLGKCKSIKEVIELSKKAEKHEGWVIGWGWNQDYFEEKRMLNKKDLDEISTEYPVAFRRCCGEMIVANSKALELCGITETMKSDSIDFASFHLVIFGEWYSGVNYTRFKYNNNTFYLISTGKIITASEYNNNEWDKIGEERSIYCLNDKQEWVLKSKESLTDILQSICRK